VIAGSPEFAADDRTAADGLPLFRPLARPGAAALRLLVPSAAAVTAPAAAVSAATSATAALPTAAAAAAAVAIDVVAPAAAEVELLQVMTSAPRRLAGSGGRWRCDLFPVFDRSFKWVAFHGRPDGKRRQVLFSYLGDPSELWMLGVEV